MTWAAGCDRRDLSMGPSEMIMQFGTLLMRTKVQLGGLPIATPWLHAIQQHELGTHPAPLRGLQGPSN